MIDKNNNIQRLSSSEYILVELGCGPRKRNFNAIGVDFIDYDGVDIVGDVYEVLSAFPEKCIDKVCAYHFIEHVPDLPNLMRELERVMKPGGKVEFVAPHFSNPYFYSDPTHRSFFGLYTFCYFATGALFSREVPTYNNDLKFVLENVDLVFKSSRPFYMRYGIKRLFGMLFNSCAYMKEFYEENLCYFFPCYEVRYRLRSVAG